MADGTEESPVSTGEDLSGKQIIRVLAVDDNEVQLLMLCRCLEQCGYKVTRFTDPNQVLEHLRENKENFDLVISDLHMPKYEDGLKLIKHVALKMELPVIVVSDKSSIEEAQQGILNGACVFVVKPVPLEFVKRIWQYALPKGKITKNENNLNPPPNPNIKNDNNKDRMLESNNGDASSRSMKKRKGAMEEDENGEDTGDDDGSGSVSRKTKKKGKRFTWTKELHGLFVGAIDQLGGVKNAVPKRIQSIMAVKGLTREHVASHLQKHRQMLQKNEKAQQGELPNALPFTNQPFAGQQFRTPLSSYCKTYSIPPSMVANILPVQNSMNAPVFMTNSNNMPLPMYPRQQQQPNHLLMSQCESDFKSLQQFGNNNNNNNNNIMSYIANVLNAAVPSSPLVFCNNVSNDEYNINNLGNNSSNNGNNGLMGNGFMGNTSSGMESTNTGYRETHLPPNLQPRAVFNNCGKPLNNSNNNGNSGLMGNGLMGNTSYILQNRFAMEGKESFNTGYNNCGGTMNNLDYSGQIIQCDGLLSVPPVIRKEAEEKNQSGFQEKAKEKNQLGFQEIAEEE